MSQVVFRNIMKVFGPQTVFEDISLTIHPGHKVGLLGSNGSGKTTLFRMILGQEPPDSGSVTLQKGLKIGYLPQEPVCDPEKTVMEIMHEGFDSLLKKHRRLEQLTAQMGTLSGDELHRIMTEYDRLAYGFETEGGWAYEARIKSLLAGVGLNQELYHKKTGHLSGGQISRLGLAGVLAKDQDLLLLDEPTNHLDLQGTRWLESFLQSCSATVVLISHDRYLLDHVVESIVELEQYKARVWKGNYSQFREQKAIHQLQQQREFEKKQSHIEHTLDFIARNKDQEGMRGTARGRKKRLERMLKNNPDYLEKPVHSKGWSFQFALSQKKGDRIASVDNVCKSFGELVLFSNLSFELERGNCLAITGPNGTGKSTLLKILLGDLQPESGSVVIGQNVKIGYLDQHAHTLNPEHTVLEEAAATRPGSLPSVLRGKLGAFGFRGDTVFQTVSLLSGGQQNRLMLFKLVLAEPDLLILDEPTNHLDINAREALEAALESFNGTSLVVSHDRYLLDRIADQLLIIGVDQLGQRQMGNYEISVPLGPDRTYSAWAKRTELLREQRQADRETAAPKTTQKKAPAQTPEEIRQFNRYTIEQLEEMILTLEEEAEHLQERFGDEKIYQDPQLLEAVQHEFENKKKELELLHKAYDFRLSKQ